MENHKNLYTWSLNDAKFFGEKELWRQSLKENCACAVKISDAIRDHYSNNCLHDCATDIIGQYGFNRVNWVLANSIQELDYDGRISRENKKWAERFRIPNDQTRIDFTVSAHPGLLDLFVNQVRHAWDALGLYDKLHCEPNDQEQDYTGKIVVLSPDILKDEFKTPEYQLFFAEGGFGTHPNSRGRKVFGTFLEDGERTHFNREDIIGVLKDEFIPEWAKEKIETMQAQPDEPVVEMGGI